MPKGEEASFIVRLPLELREDFKIFAKLIAKKSACEIVRAFMAETVAPHSKTIRKIKAIASK